MKRQALLGHLQEHGCVPLREGGRKEAIPCHNEIKKFLARSICRNLSVPIPPGSQESSADHDRSN